MGGQSMYCSSDLRQFADEAMGMCLARCPLNVFLGSHAPN